MGFRSVLITDQSEGHKKLPKLFLVITPLYAVRPHCSNSRTGMFAMPRTADFLGYQLNSASTSDYIMPRLWTKFNECTLTCWSFCLESPTWGTLYCKWDFCF